LVQVKLLHSSLVRFFALPSRASTTRTSCILRTAAGQAASNSRTEAVKIYLSSRASTAWVSAGSAHQSRLRFVLSTNHSDRFHPRLETTPDHVPSLSRSGKLLHTLSFETTRVTGPEPQPLRQAPPSSLHNPERQPRDLFDAPTPGQVLHGLQDMSRTSTARANSSMGVERWPCTHEIVPNVNHSGKLHHRINNGQYVAANHGGSPERLAARANSIHVRASKDAFVSRASAAQASSEIRLPRAATDHVPGVNRRASSINDLQHLYDPSRASTTRASPQPLGQATPRCPVPGVNRSGKLFGQPASFTFANCLDNSIVPSINRLGKLYHLMLMVLAFSCVPSVNRLGKPYHSYHDQARGELSQASTAWASPITITIRQEANRRILSQTSTAWASPITVINYSIVIPQSYCPDLPRSREPRIAITEIVKIYLSS
jgi:hypothetical protein